MESIFLKAEKTVGASTVIVSGFGDDCFSSPPPPPEGFAFVDAYCHDKRLVFNVCAIAAATHKQDKNK